MTKQRKLDHIKLALENKNQDNVNYWDQVSLPYQALPEKDFDQIDTSVDFLGKQLSLPLIIGPMTVPVDDSSFKLNQLLVQLVHERGVAFALGSQRIMIENNLDKRVKKLRKLAPQACLLANFGAVQLNYGWGTDQVQRCIDSLEADGLMLHLNLLQELIQPNGNTDFSGLLGKIEKLVKQIKLPVIVKEVGFGIDPATAKKLYQIGVYGIDVAGKGGTNWAKIESSRRLDSWARPMFEIGWPAPHLVEKIAGLKPKEKVLIASGGIRHGLHIAKAIHLGADMASMAQPFLTAAQSGYNNLINLYNRLSWQYKVGLMVSFNNKQVIPDSGINQ